MKKSAFEKLLDNIMKYDVARESKRTKLANLLLTNISYKEIANINIKLVMDAAMEAGKMLVKHETYYHDMVNEIKSAKVQHVNRMW